MKDKLTILKKAITSICYVCDGEGNVFVNNVPVACPCCKGTGKYVEQHYFHICRDKKGIRYCIDGDTVK